MKIERPEKRPPRMIVWKVPKEAEVEEFVKVITKKYGFQDGSIRPIIKTNK